MLLKFSTKFESHYLLAKTKLKYNVSHSSPNLKNGSKNFPVLNSKRNCTIKSLFLKKEEKLDMCFAYQHLMKEQIIKL